MLLSQLNHGRCFVFTDGRETIYHKIGQSASGACLIENTKTGLQGWSSGRKTIVEVAPEKETMR